MDRTDYNQQLLGTLDFEALLSTVAALIQESFQPKASAILVWDPDLETFSDRRCFGEKSAELGPLAKQVAEELEANPDFKTPISSKLSQSIDSLGDCYCFRLQESEELSACLILAGITIQSPQEIENRLAGYPLLLAMKNGWEIRELKRENERLRSRYDDLEEQNSSLVEQTRKLIQDLKVKDGLRYRNIEQEKLIYEISSAVRSSVEIEQVLQNAAHNVGEKCFLSRCIILRPSSIDNELYVYEYHNSTTGASRELFFSELGQRFLDVALSKSAPCDLAHVENDPEGDFDSKFLKQFGFLSALLIPLIMRGRTMGCMIIQDCSTARPWNIEDMTFFGSIADQLSVAVENADLHEEKKSQAVTDSLTGLANRRKFNDVFQKEFERAKRYAEPLTLVVIDMDFLKVINDKFGHTAGDNAIKSVADVLANSSRSIDLSARYGGEEFCLLLPNTKLEESTIIADRIRKRICETTVPLAGKVSASLGIANFPLHAQDADDLFQKADQALYAAKEGGRNQVQIFKGGD
ncbi:MAG: diguanylate cyclase [Candidatus Obscuribacterales bacterium]|nr:diguanylate cyclase [Candidatus Obscuribacterales bacterium]